MILKFPQLKPISPERLAEKIINEEITAMQAALEIYRAYINAQKTENEENEQSYRQDRESSLTTRPTSPEGLEG